MNGKGSKPRPMTVSYKTFGSNWDNIFKKKDNDMIEHSENVTITEKISNYYSDNGKREAVIIKTEKGFSVELYEKSKYIKTVDLSGHSLRYVEDAAENYVNGWANL